MKKIVIVAVMAIAVGLFSGCGNSNKKSDTGTQKDEDSLAYAMGIMESQQMKMALSQIGVDSAYIDEFIKESRTPATRRKTLTTRDLP